jgi:colicin import membrane protein
MGIPKQESALYSICKARASSSFASALLAVVCVMPVLGASSDAHADIADSKPNPGLDVDASERRLFALSQALLQDPQNPELLLQKGVLLFELGKLQAAFEVFEALRTTFPEQPAPYANLASLYARLGRLEESRQMLLQSDALQGNQVQTQLSLASVNMGLALAALGKANTLKPGDAVTQRKLQALEKIVADTSAPYLSAGNTTLNSDRGVNAAPSYARPSKTTKERTVNPPLPARDRLSLMVPDIGDTSPPPSTTPAPTPAAAVPALPAKVQGVTTAGTTLPALTVATPAALQGAEETAKAEVLKAVEAWGKAWAQRSYTDYLAAYGLGFQPPEGAAREAWARRKQAVMEKAQYIKLEIKVSGVQLSGKTATVKLSQHYRSDRHTDFSRKELTLNLEEGGWKIVAEKPSK